MDSIKNLVCTVCDGTDFNLKEGFYYCTECGTQHKNIIDIEFENEDELYTGNKRKHATKLKNAEKKLEITTWEVYNYILRGLVDELIQLGAKSELQETVLQLWASILRHHQVAFFNKKRSELPKLGIRYSLNDARVLYNQQIKKKSRKKRPRSVAGSEKSKKKIAMERKQYEKNEYERLSQSGGSHSTMMSTSISVNSSITLETTKAVQLCFTTKAKKQFKKTMPLKHLKKHELDHGNTLSCHTMKVKACEMTIRDKLEEINRTALYTIIYVALNLIDDDIQLSDLLRYMEEGHISFRRVIHFFPEDLKPICMGILTKNYYFMDKMVMPAERIQRKVIAVCRQVHVKDLKLPNILELCRRYVTDLALPSDMTTYLERLINMYPPHMKTNFSSKMSPNFEARAMAYIIFFLKLTFGLNGTTENIISESATQLNTSKACNLFVLNDWIRYIELRKLIMGYHDVAFSQRYSCECNSDNYINFLKTELDQFEYDQDNVNAKKMKLLNMNILFNKFVGKFVEEPTVSIPHRVSLTPNVHFFERLLAEDNLNIPDFMRTYPVNSTVVPFIFPNTLQTALSDEHKVYLRIEKADFPTTEQIGIFKNYQQNMKIVDATSVRLRQLHFNIGEDRWKEQVNEKFASRNKLFSTEFEKEPNQIMHQIFKADVQFMNNQPRADEQPHTVEDERKENAQNWEEVILKVSDFQYWTLLGQICSLNMEQENQVKRKLPLKLVWLLEHFAQVIGVKWSIVYNELLVLEATFIEVLDRFDGNMITFKRQCTALVQGFRQQW